MPNRILKESIWTSPNLNALSPLAERYFYRLLPLPDDFGCFEATPLVVLGRCFPLRKDCRESDIEKWNKEIEAEGIVRFWVDSGRLYGVFTNWEKHQRVRSLHQRKTPQPPPLDATCRQMTADDGLNPNPNPNPLSPPYIPPNGFGEFKNVIFKEGQHQKMGDLLGSKREEYIERLSSYLEQIGPHSAKKYKSHYATILNWNRKDRQQEKSGGGSGTGSVPRRFNLRGTQGLPPGAIEEADRINASIREGRAAKLKADDHPSGDAG
jgi:hypothetical protein